MFCASCGNQINKRGNYCSACGAKISEQNLGSETKEPVRKKSFTKSKWFETLFWKELPEKSTNDRAIEKGSKVKEKSVEEIIEDGRLAYRAQVKEYLDKKQELESRAQSSQEIRSALIWLGS